MSELALSVSPSLALPIQTTSEKQLCTSKKAIMHLSKNFADQMITGQAISPNLYTMTFGTPYTNDKRTTENVSIYHDACI